MEQSKLHSAQLVNVEVSFYPFFSKQEKANTNWQLCDEEN